MASLQPRFQSLLSPLSKITVIQIIFFMKKTLPDEERILPFVHLLSTSMYTDAHFLKEIQSSVPRLSSRAVQYHDQYSLQCHVISFCRGGRSRLVLTVSTSHSIPVLIPSLEKDTPKLSGEKA